MVRKLGTRAHLEAADEAAILALPHVLHSHNPCTYLVREGEQPRRHCAFLRRGFAFRQKLTAEGARQIVSLHMPGDFLDIEQLFLKFADHNVQALTPLEVIGVERDALQALAIERPNVAKAMWVDALVDGSVSREWVTNVGRRNARARIAHVICEFATRLRALGLAATEIELPMTQEQLADVVGLTPVHVNRTLRSLEQDGIVVRDKRTIRFADWSRLAAVGDFNALYLHLDQAGPIE